MVLNGVSITETVTGLGYAFATTSYSTNGLAVRPAISDLLDLVNIFTTTRSLPDRIYLLGVSEGGLITTLSVEEHPDVYDGGLAMCGPYGDFQGQINHFGDFRVVFDYFFPGLVPGDPLSITASLQQAWQTGFFTETVMPVITDTANAVSVTQLLSVTGVSPYEFAPPTSTASIERLLWYNVFATNDGVEKLGGQPYGNVDRFYTGSSNDAALNDEVVRVTADPTATAAIEEHYQTTGELSAPVVTLHTTGDPVVPYRHALEYRQKVESASSGFFHRHFEVEGHGHCAFSQLDVLTAFGTLVEMVNNPPTTIYLPAVARAP
jgi:pimeloyl-ACP methyl ester carboxylesterase